MIDPDLGLDPHNVPLPRLKQLYRRIEKLQRWGGGYGRFLLILEQAINTHPENPNRQESKSTSNTVEYNG